ncbi:MAG: MMPL family transporter [Planctomycetes bacterium]|nr:MMPL family transporter [Planctomycetota bacterium]
MARLSVRTTFGDGNAYVPFIVRLEAGLRKVFGDGPEITVTGIGAVMGRTFGILNVTMAQSYAIALVVITPLMVLLIGNLGRGLLSMIPNLLPIWLTLGLMGLLGIPLDSSTLLLGCVVIGLAVDDTIHFMHKFQRYLAVSGDARAAVRETLQTTGAALFFTTLVITAGFSTMLFGYMNNAREFGLLATFAAATAFLADLLVAPALMALATRQRTGIAVPGEATVADGRA